MYCALASHMVKSISVSLVIEKKGGSIIVCPCLCFAQAAFTQPTLIPLTPKLNKPSSFQNLGVTAMSHIVLFVHDSFFGRGFQDHPILFVSICFPSLLVW